MLYNLKDIIRLVDKEDRGIAAFNVFGYEDSQAVIEAAESIGRPVIIMANKDAVNHMGVELIGEIMLHVGAQAKVPVDVHLDHATDMEVIERAIRSGYTSVMFDGSQLPFDENVERTRHVVEMAHAMDISVEAEIGAVGYSDPDIRFNARFTEPQEAKRFAQLTGVDALAVAVVTVHRMEMQKAELQFDRLQEIAKQVDIPLVIHGSTGVADENLAKLVRFGARKINIGTALRMEFGQTLRRQFADDSKEFDRIKLFGPCMEAVKDKAVQKMELL